MFCKTKQRTSPQCRLAAECGGRSQSAPQQLVLAGNSGKSPLPSEAAAVRARRNNSSLPETVDSHHCKVRRPQSERAATIRPCRKQRTVATAFCGGRRQSTPEQFLFSENTSDSKAATSAQAVRARSDKEALSDNTGESNAEISALADRARSDNTAASGTFKILGISKEIRRQSLARQKLDFRGR